MSTAQAEPVDIAVPSPLDESVVQRLATALTRAAAESTDRLAALTRRAAEIAIGDVLEPIDVTKLRLEDLVMTALCREEPDGDRRVVALAVFEARGAISLVDLFLGGPGVGQARELAALELEVLGRQIPIVASPLVTAALGSADEELLLVPVDDEDIIPLDNRLVRLGVRLVVNEIEVPFALLVPDPTQPAAPELAAGSDAALDPVPLVLEIALGPVVVSTEDIEELTPGDVLRLDHRLDAPANGLIGDELVLLASLGRSNGHVAVNIEQIALQP